MYIYIYIYVHTHTPTYIYIYIYICMHTHAHIYIYIEYLLELFSVPSLSILSSSNRTLRAKAFGLTVLGFGEFRAFRG